VKRCLLMFADVCFCKHLQASCFSEEMIVVAHHGYGAQTTIISATSRNGDHAGAFFVLVGVAGVVNLGAVIRDGSGPDVASCLGDVLRHPASCWGALRWIDC